MFFGWMLLFHITFTFSLYPHFDFYLYIPRCKKLGIHTSVDYGRFLKATFFHCAFWKGETKCCVTEYQLDNICIELKLNNYSRWPIKVFSQQRICFHLVSFALLVSFFFFRCKLPLHSSLDICFSKTKTKQTTNITSQRTRPCWKRILRIYI